MSKAKNIFNFSIYQWPSNYSYWIAKSYKINYKYIQIIRFAEEVFDYLSLEKCNAKNINYENEIKKLLQYDVLNKSQYMFLYE